MSLTSILGRCIDRISDALAYLKTKIYVDDIAITKENYPLPIIIGDGASPMSLRPYAVVNGTILALRITPYNALGQIAPANPLDVSVISGIPSPLPIRLQDGSGAILAKVDASSLALHSTLFPYQDTDPIHAARPNTDNFDGTNIVSLTVRAQLHALDDTSGNYYIFRMRDASNKSLLASAARTISGNSGDLIIWNIKMGLFYCNVSARSGTSPTLDVIIEAKDPVSGNYAVIGRFSQYVDATGFKYGCIGLGAIDDADSDFATSRNLPKIIRISWTITGTTPSFTFSVGISGQD